MTNKIATTKERILQLIERKGLKKEKFFSEIGMTYGNFTGINKKTPINSNAIANILSIIPELNVEWLITGLGEMVKPPNNQLVQLPTSVVAGVPLVSHHAAAGFGNANFTIHNQDVEGRYIIPDFVNVDFLIRLKGSSMLPDYDSGDVVACRILKESTFLQWNKPYVIATKEQGLLCKRLLPAKNDTCITAVSNNASYPPFDIPKTEITGIALVVGVIRMV